jgi:hypothetical protein
MEPFPISWNPRLSQQLAAPDRAVAKHMRSFGGALLAALAIPAAHALPAGPGQDETHSTCGACGSIRW